MLWSAQAARKMLSLMLPLLPSAGCGEREIPVPRLPLQVDESLLERCPDPLLPQVGRPRRENDAAVIDAYGKLAICQDRHGQLVRVVRKAQEPPPK